MASSVFFDNTSSAQHDPSRASQEASASGQPGSLCTERDEGGEASRERDAGPSHCQANDLAIQEEASSSSSSLSLSLPLSSGSAALSSNRPGDPPPPSLLFSLKQEGASEDRRQNAEGGEPTRESEAEEEEEEEGEKKTREGLRSNIDLPGEGKSCPFTSSSADDNVCSGSSKSSSSTSAGSRATSPRTLVPVPFLPSDLSASFSSSSSSSSPSSCLPPAASGSSPANTREAGQENDSAGLRQTTPETGQGVSSSSCTSSLSCGDGDEECHNVLSASVDHPHERRGDGEEKERRRSSTSDSREERSTRSDGEGERARTCEPPPPPPHAEDESLLGIGEGAPQPKRKRREESESTDPTDAKEDLISQEHTGNNASEPSPFSSSPSPMLRVSSANGPPGNPGRRDDEDRPPQLEDCHHVKAERGGALPSHKMKKETDNEKHPSSLCHQDSSSCCCLRPAERDFCSSLNLSPLLYQMISSALLKQAQAIPGVDKQNLSKKKKLKAHAGKPTKLH